MLFSRRLDSFFFSEYVFLAAVEEDFDGRQCKEDERLKPPGGLVNPSSLKAH